jgi:hypothetical protein
MKIFIHSFNIISLEDPHFIPLVMNNTYGYIKSQGTFWSATLCRLTFTEFRRYLPVHLHDQKVSQGSDIAEICLCLVYFSYLDDRNCTVLRNIGELLPEYTVSHSRIQHSSYSSL